MRPQDVYELNWAEYRILCVEPEMQDVEKDDKVFVVGEDGDLDAATAFFD